MSTKPNFGVVYGKVNDATPKFKQTLPWVAIALVLLHGIGNSLFGQAVFQLKRGYGQSVHEQSEVQSKRSLFSAVTELSRHREAILLGPRCRLDVAWCWGSVEEIDVVSAVLDSVPQCVDNAAFA